MDLFMNEEHSFNRFGEIAIIKLHGTESGEIRPETARTLSTSFETFHAFSTMSFTSRQNRRRICWRRWAIASIMNGRSRQLKEPPQYPSRRDYWTRLLLSRCSLLSEPRGTVNPLLGRKPHLRTLPIKGVLWLHCIGLNVPNSNIELMSTIIHRRYVSL